MARFEILLPSMGESITEATLLNYTKKVGDIVEEDETIAEVATDKVDSEVPSPVKGTIIELPYQKDDVVEIGKVLVVLETSEVAQPTASNPAPTPQLETAQNIATKSSSNIATESAVQSLAVAQTASNTTEINQPRYSPLVKTICKKKGIPLSELSTLSGTGQQGRITKKDLLKYIEERAIEVVDRPKKSTPSTNSKQKAIVTPTMPIGASDQVIEMDRMRRMIAHHMVESKRTSPHVSTFVEVDVTNIVNWRNKFKTSFLEKYGEKLTYTPIFFEAITKAIKDFPAINASTFDNKIIIKKEINLGMATALPTGNLIVPVVKNADKLNIVGMAVAVNRLAHAARSNQLKPSDIQGGTFTISNIGTFGNDAGTPIINQPQAAILALGAINKKPAVITTEIGDVIAIRHRMILSISFDHRIIDGFLGGSFLRRVGDYLEQFDRTDI